MSIRNLLITAGVLLPAGVLTALWFLSPAPAPQNAAMKQVAGDFLRARYAQDHEKAYSFISSRDQRVKSKTDYMRENPSFPALTRALATQLAELIDIGPITANTTGKRATIEFPIRLPDANSAKLQELFKEFDPDRLAEIPPEERRKIIDIAKTMYREGRLPTIAGTETLELVKENGAWRVFVDWTDTVKVVFKAAVKEGLPWAFEPVQKAVMAKPGETLHAAYRAKNLSNVTLTAKARHLDEPKELAAKYLDVIQCFCFIRETLAPGEEKELPLVFRVDLDVPREIEEFVVTYQFFPLDKFPKSSE